MSTTTTQRPAEATTRRAAEHAVERPDDSFIHDDHIGHGSTPAAWTLSITLIIGSVLGGIGFVVQLWALVWVAAACVPLALILGAVLKKAGHGVEIDSSSVLRRDPARSGR
ncbi:HGxxPAAW family protein [Nesterenkonia sp. F]|uniref:HGxxPAAW family protein n=1 Tax=Nesterenkonia sp. F TaxID=795955 RepID=UPI000255CD44|nr:HGxxPAAW family protein [Nesterenkonia sp. F]